MADITIIAAAPDDEVGLQDVLYRTWLATYPNAERGITAADIEDWHKHRNVEEKIAQRREHLANIPFGETMLIAKDGVRTPRIL